MPDAYEQRRPYQEDGHLAVPDCTCPLKWPPEHLPECPSFGAPQEPRTGGVAVIYDPSTLGFYRALPDDRATHLAIPLAEAEALIDPNDPAVRSRLLTLLAEFKAGWGSADAVADEFLWGVGGKP